MSALSEIIQVLKTPLDEFLHLASKKPRVGEAGFEHARKLPPLAESLAYERAEAARRANSQVLRPS